MKTSLLLLFSLGFAQVQLRAQAVAAPTTAVPAVTVRTLDPLAAQRQLLITPKSVPLPASAVPPVTAPPQPVVKTTKTTTTVETPGLPPRVYQSERSVVVVGDQNQTRELPYVTLPVLFVQGTADLLDAESRSALEQIANVIKTVIAAEPTAMFDIEGHTSTDGLPDFNTALSVARAQRVYDELTLRYGVPATVLSAHGYGSSYAMFPNGTEPQLQLDRRVLVVRTR
ncbi:OmpA family protein [Prosthecobacter sp.]|uniref:OmpA family protein n=1 Tax=Prosthecobacter sp. TaxID=1965333 RepID=UPI003784391D